jgi:hypothetical protein
VSFNAAGQGGSNGGGWRVAVAVLAEIGEIKDEVGEKIEFFLKIRWGLWGLAVVQRVAVVGWQ